ncbi:class I SAM-dependent methyltransferase [Lacimonas salitolerans]|uniref:Class I SAM-dependent methyltransferase n=1 Tax=Lacimonas salitolerans TaxID=1323750 RepID=A0ABW4ED28_9RHOB
MDAHDLLIDLHRDGIRQGPGGNDETRLAITLSGLRDTRGLRIADIGCGTGAATRVLATELDAAITAVDLMPAFLDELTRLARAEGLGDRITPLAASMEALPFDPQSLDAIWSEGAIYSMGFAEGVQAWRHFLKPGGVLAVSDLTWLTTDRPADLHDHWTREYPQVATAAEKLATLEQAGYSPLGYFPLPARCWLDTYYRPLQARFGDFLSRNRNSERAQAVVAAERQEIALYERNTEHVSYGYYVARRIG